MYSSVFIHLIMFMVFTCSSCSSCSSFVVAVAVAIGCGWLLLSFVLSYLVCFATCAASSCSADSPEQVVRNAVHVVFRETVHPAFLTFRNKVKQLHVTENWDPLFLIKAALATLAAQEYGETFTIPVLS
ncbi:hypothetical protein BJ741DRAFT_391130 [Chytriomyces cf. hyalinus JEL632]|nr:hypothetical protein BJ741DRAFT_391130 [Chytriomyces cf. hyalinus JEL632]